MPRPGERRKATALRLDSRTGEAIDQRAVDEEVLNARGEVNRSDMIRLFIAYGLQHMPQGWRPEGWQPSR